MIASSPNNCWLIRFDFFQFGPIQQDSKSVWSHDLISMPLSHDIATVVWTPSDCLEKNNLNVPSNKVSYWWKTLGRWSYESRNISPWRYKFKKSRDKNKNLIRSVFCSTRTPSEKNKTGTLRPSDSSVFAWWFLRGFWLNRIPHSVVFIIDTVLCVKSEILICNLLNTKNIIFAH